MARRKSVCVKWTLVLTLVLFSSFVCSRPQDSPPSVTTVSSISETEISAEKSIRPTDDQNQSNEDSSRGVKGKSPAIGDSIKMVTSQLLEKPSNKTADTVVSDTRIPPKLKTQIAQKNKIKTRNEDGIELGNSHAGIAVPVSMEEMDLESAETVNESSTSNEGISTWILVSNPTNTASATEPSKAADKKQKLKNKNKRPLGKLPNPKRPIIGSTNKSDLVAGGSAINENVYNKIKDTVLSNVQKNKNSARTTTTTTLAPSTEILTTKKEVTTKSPTTVSVKSTSKLNKKTNKTKQKVTTNLIPTVPDSAMLPMEPKEQEIELEISTPATTTKKPKRSSTKKKTKTKKRKTTKPKPEATTAVAPEVKNSTKTKSTKLQKKPSSTTGPFTTQIYNYFSREVMPSVGVGVIGLAGLLGIAGYFLYPFTAAPVRRTFEVDKKDDIYKHNAEEYADDGNGQPEEEMLGTVLAGMPAHTKQKYNPYAAQTTHVNRYPIKKEQDIRHRQVTKGYEPKYNVHYQQKTGIAHGAAYPEPLYHHHHHHKYDSRHAYTTERPSSYAPFPAVEPIYTAPQTGPSSYGNESPGAVVYGVKPSHDSEFKPVYPYEAQYHSETTSNPATYSPTSLYLGSNNEAELDNSRYTDENNDNSEGDNKFVVGNIPKELTDTATPAVVPEHGPRKLRRRRSSRKKRNIVGSIEEILKARKENKENEIFISNEIDGEFESAYKNPPMGLGQNKDLYTVYTVSGTEGSTKAVILDADKNEMVESVSTLPIANKNEKTEISNDVEETTKTFKIYETFNINDATEKSSPLMDDDKRETTTQIRNMNTETTTETRSETTSNMPPSPSVFIETTSKPTDGTEIITYPPSSSSGYGFFDFIKRLVEFKYRLGLSILQTTSDSLYRYLKSLEGTRQKSVKSH